MSLAVGRARFHVKNKGWITHTSLWADNALRLSRPEFSRDGVPDGRPLKSLATKVPQRGKPLQQ